MLKQVKKMSVNSAAIRRSASLVPGAFVLILVLCSVVTAQAEEIRIGGTGGALGIMRKLAAEYKKTHPRAPFRILPSLGSSGGIKALSAGVLDLALSSIRPGAKATGLVFRELGRTPLVFATARSGPLSGISLKEVEDLYSGRTSRWADGSRSRVVLRPATEYDVSLLKSMSPEMDRAVSVAMAREGMIIGVTDQDNAHAIETVPGAIGTITLGQLIAERCALKPLALDGVKPGLDTLADGSYPYFKTYYVVSQHKPGSAAEAFLHFIRSPAGRKILTEAGYQVGNR